MRDTFRRLVAMGVRTSLGAPLWAKGDRLGIGGFYGQYAHFGIQRDISGYGISQPHMAATGSAMSRFGSLYIRGNSSRGAPI